MERPWILVEQNHFTLPKEKWEVAVLPFGATEPHNLHMPYGTDNFQVEEIGQLALFLCSDHSGFITGTDILIDGGWCAQ